MTVVPLVESVSLAPRRRMPPFILLPEVQTLRVLLVRVKTPEPNLVKALALLPPPELKVPEKVVDVLSPPTLRVLPEAPEFFTVPAPDSDPMVIVWVADVPLRSSVPKVPMVTGLLELLI